MSETLPIFYITLQTASKFKLKSSIFLLILFFSVFTQAGNSGDKDSLFIRSMDLLYQKPSESAKIAQFLFENSSDENDKLKSLFILIESNLIRGDYNAAIESWFRSWELSQHPDIKKNEGKINSLLYMICDELGVEKRGLYLISDNFSEDVTLELSWKNAQYSEPYSSYLISKKQFSQGNFNQSVAILNGLKPFDDKVQNVHLREEIYGLNAQNYKEINDLKQYLVYYNLQNALNDSINALKENARILFINRINQKQNDLLEKKTEHQTKTIDFILVAIASVFITGYFFNHTLDFKQKNIQKFIMEAEERERNGSEIKFREGAGKIVIPEKTIHSLMKKLDEFEKNNNYLDASMSLNLLAENLNTNTKYLSEIINTYKNKNFHSYINELRINYIVAQLKNNPVYLKYKVSHLAEEAGFSSHSLFSTVFKQVTGYSPALYIKSLQKNI